MVLRSLISRNIKMFFKDKGLVISSLITPMILILLYVTFLKNVYVDSFHSAVNQVGIVVEEKCINGFVYGWLFSSLLAVSSVTISFCSNLLMVQDKVTGSIHDLGIAPVKKTTLAIAYYVASMTETLIIVYFETIVSFIIMAFNGWFLSFTDVVFILLEVFLLVNFGTALSSIIHHYLTTQGQMSAVGTIVSSVYGFICGAYMPISQFGSGLQKVLSFLPGTYATSVIRYHFENGVLNNLRIEN
ncbi:MAG: ABC transporter permease, partial [Anaeroplasma sp.]